MDPKSEKCLEIPEIERWIELNTVPGKPSVLKTLWPEPDDPEFWYTLRRDGTRYGQFGIFPDEGFNEDGEPVGEYLVVHVKSGRTVGTPFSSEDLASRMIFCLKGLTDWRKLDWSDFKTFEKSPWRLICNEASAYCHQIPGNYERLLKLIKPLLPEDKSVIEELVAEAEPVAFGEGEVFVPKVQAQESADDWGQLIT